MDTSKTRIDLIRERHRKLILEPRREMEYSVVGDWAEAPLFDDEELAASFAGPGETEDDE
jgi:hypothetical protein